MKINSRRTKQCNSKELLKNLIFVKLDIQYHLAKGFFETYYFNDSGLKRWKFTSMSISKLCSVFLLLILLKGCLF